MKCRLGTLLGRLRSVHLNYTIAGRLHLIWRSDLRYLTIWLLGRRFHWGTDLGTWGYSNRGGWELD